MPKRIFDVVFSITMLLVILIPILLTSVLIRVTSPGPAIYWFDRVGKNNKLFSMPKFRTMRVGTPTVATHQMKDACLHITPIGKFLRKTSLDEVPQLWSILVGDMSVVGPRPALFNQDDLIDLRSNAGIDKLTPGLTGWAQINGRDALPIPEKVRLDREYSERRSFWFDLQIIMLTCVKVLNKQDVSH